MSGRLNSILFAPVSSPNRRTVAVIVLMLCVIASARACQTPVFRYAMYNWEPTAYRVYYFPQGEETAADREVSDLLKKHSSTKPVKTNIQWIAVTKKDRQAADAKGNPLQAELAFVLKIFQGKKLPKHVVLSPHGTVMFSGSLDSKEVVGMVGSPVRTQLTAMLSGKYAGVMILLTSDDKQANDDAEKKIKDVIAQAASGKIKRDNAPIERIVPNKNNNEPSENYQIGIIKLSHKNEREKWLIRSLLNIDNDLVGLKKTMVFTAYGRCRVMDPCVGKGIKTEYLADDVKYIIAPCSCNVKEQNRGMDLITQADWHTAAEALAQRIGSETGNGHLLGDNIFPQILPPIDDQDAIETTSADEGKSETVQPKKSEAKDKSKSDGKLGDQSNWFQPRRFQQVRFVSFVDDDSADRDLTATPQEPDVKKKR